MKVAFTLVLFLCSFYTIQAQTREAFNWGTDGKSYVTCYDTPNSFCAFPASWTSGNIISNSMYSPITTTITTTAGSVPIVSPKGVIVYSSGPEAEALSYAIASSAVNTNNAFITQTFTFSYPICNVQFVIQGIIGGASNDVQDEVIISATTATGTVTNPTSITPSVDASVSGNVITGVANSLGGNGNTIIAFSGCIKSLSLTLRVPSGATSPFSDGSLRALIYPNDITFDPAIQPLPVRFSFFKATSEENAIRLNWQTIFETSADYFVVQKSKDALEFANLTTIKSAIESNQPIDYEYVDRAPEPGLTYYRLRVVDQDGSSSFSQIISCRSDGLVDRGIYPNPSSGSFKLRATDDIVAYWMTSTLGKNVDVLMTKKGEDYQVNFSGKPTQGVYVLTVYTSKGFQKHKVVIE